MDKRKTYYIGIKPGGEEFDFFVGKLLAAGFVFSLDRYKTLTEIHRNWCDSYPRWDTLKMGLSEECRAVIHACSEYSRREMYISLEDFLKLVALDQY